MPDQSQNAYRIYGDPEIFEEKTRLKAGRKNVIVAGALGCLSIVLFDDTGTVLITNADYRIKGPNGEEYTGTTDDEGYLFHPDVPVDDYELTVGDSAVRVPVVLEQGERHLQRVIGYEMS
jgi:hypothetical protein